MIELTILLIFGYISWVIVVSVFGHLFGLSIKCPECGRRIEQNSLGFSSKFSCICGVTGLVTVRWFWINKIDKGNWISSNGKKKHCTSCANEIPENNNFCVRCGHSQEQPHPEYL